MLAVGEVDFRGTRELSRLPPGRRHDRDSRPWSAVGVIASVLLTLALAGGAQATAPAEVVAQIQVHGNLLTPEEEVIRLAEVRVGMPFEASTIETVTTRLRATRRFVNVEVLKRFASIADPSQIIIVIIVDDGPVRVNWETGEVQAPGGNPGRAAGRA